MNDPSSVTGSDAGPKNSLLTKPFRPLRIWPAGLLIVLLFVTRFVPAHLSGGMTENWVMALLGPLVSCLLLLIWWLTASRATGKERVFGLIGLITSLAVTVALVDPTLRGTGTGYLTLPMGMVMCALGAILWGKHRPMVRTRSMILLAFSGFGFPLLLRNEGLTGGYVMTMKWR